MRVFARYGFRKASMDEVARAAGVSRQGLYLQFANKEELFRKAVEHSLNSRLNAAVAALSRRQDSLELRLIAACDAWSGRFVGSLGSDAADLMCASTSLAGATLTSSWRLPAPSRTRQWTAFAPRQVCARRIWRARCMPRRGV